ncbi:FecR family protein [Larkinella harenae]
MNSYLDYTPEDFAITPSFVIWVMHHAQPEWDRTTVDLEELEQVNFWDTWLRQHPHKEPVIAQAQTLVLAVQTRFRDDLTPDVLKEDINRLIQRADASLHTTHDASEKGLVRPLWQQNWVKWAAVFVLILGIGVYWYSQPVHHNQGIVEKMQQDLIEKSNQTSRPMTVLLSDGSVVTLSPHSQLTYPVSFTGTSRPVRLVGEAFFDIHKNAAQPFLVYTTTVVTKVLGTSFRIQAFTKDATVRVMVRTGKVSIFNRAEFDRLKPSAQQDPTGITLVPNQQVIFSPSSLSARPKVLPIPRQLAVAPAVGPTEVTFDDQQVADVFRTLSRLYEVDITFDESVLATCRITTTFAEETLPERLSSICRAIGASYRITNDSIEITSKGCKR